MKTLEGRCILLGVTGSIAAVETVKLIHTLRRRGAVVQAVMSQAACGIIHPDALTYACGRPAITRISGLVEHVQFCGDEGEADLILIAPATANTISKIACGIDDTPVTTFATTALGRRMPFIVVPAMHHAMFRHCGVSDNLARLKSYGIVIVGPRIEEGKAKIAEISEIILSCERQLMGSPLLGKRVVITSGRCEEPVDDVRILTTRSSGMMGQELAKAAFRLGADVTLIHHDHLPVIHNVMTGSAESMFEAVRNELSKSPVDLYISAAAVSDFAPKRYPGKIPSGADISIDLTPLPKILDFAVSQARSSIAFKLGEKSVLEAATLLDKGVTLVAANTPDTMGASSGRYTCIDREGMTEISGTKEEIAHLILDLFMKRHPDSLAGPASGPEML